MRIKFSRLNLESEAAYDVITDKGFYISEMPYADIDKSIRNTNGPRSPRFGTVKNDVNEFMDRYRCDCGHYIGAAFEGRVCERCGTKVQYKDVDVNYFGYLNFAPFRLINPLFYQRMQSALSRKALEDIISNENIITAQGIIRSKDDDLEVKKSVLKYHNIGLNEFYLHFEEIMEYFKTKRKQKAELIDSLIRDKDLVWTSKIPIFSTILRPAVTTVENYYFSSVTC